MAKMTKAEAGRLGGLATFRKYGSEHMSELGKRGFQATTEKHFGGDPEAHKNYIIQKGTFAYWESTGLPPKWIGPGLPMFRDPGIHPAQKKSSSENMNLGEKYD